MWPRSRNENSVGGWSAVAPPSCYSPGPPPGATGFRPRQPCDDGLRADFNRFNNGNRHSPPQAQRCNNTQQQNRFTLQQQQFSSPPRSASTSNSSEHLGVHSYVVNKEGINQFKAGTWVETGTLDGSCYYYHAETRETTWSRPVGPGINIILHKDFHVDAASRNQAANQIPSSFHTDNVPHGSPTLPLPVQSPQLTSPSQFSSPTMNSGTPPVPIMIPPPFAPFNMPPFMMNLPWNPAPQVPQPGMPLFSVPPPVTPAIYIPPHIEPSVSHAHEWSEHVSPEGMPFYHNSTTGVSTWEKPEPLKQLELLKTKEAPVCSSTSEERVLRSPNKHKRKEKKKTAGGKQTSSSGDTQGGRKPVLCKHVVGASWCVVFTNDKKMFYYNPMKKESVWERPMELFIRKDVDEIITTGYEELRKKEKKTEIVEASSTTACPPSTMSEIQPSVSQTTQPKQ